MTESEEKSKNTISQSSGDDVIAIELKLTSKARTSRDPERSPHFDTRQTKDSEPQKKLA
jgi:hypothetical protein